MTESPQSFWRRLWSRWLKIAGIIGDFQARVVLSLFYFLIVLPFGLAVRLSGDPLRIKRPRTTNWTAFAPRARTLADMRKQY